MEILEFLMAEKSAMLAEYLKGKNDLEPLPELFAHQLEEKLRRYFITGGMPEVVRTC